MEIAYIPAFITWLKTLASAQWFVRQAAGPETGVKYEL